MSYYLLPNGNVQIAFSGGRTSGFMLYHLLKANGGLPDDRCVVTFQNTGREHPATLDFVQECSRRWGVDIVWLEYRPDKPRYAVVDHATASRDGAPFEALIRQRKYLPNVMARFCTIELKIRTVKHYLISRGWDYWTNAIGIRADEQRRIRPENDRAKERWTTWQPLNHAGVTKADVSAFWDRQPFTLGLPNINGKTPLGNCMSCFLKSEATLAAIARDYPDDARWWEGMETLGSELTGGSAARFSKRFSRRELRESVERQGDWIFDDQEYLCQKDEGECI